MAEINFYQNHLNRVSRSFAFCIPLLRSDLRHQVSLAYLLFRVIDTIEDSLWSSSVEQTACFQKFIGFLEQRPTVGELMIWQNSFPTNSVPEEERNLIQDMSLLLEDFYSLPSVSKEMMKQSLMEMANGMIHFSNKSQVGLKTMFELNQYCFFVAGLVGELLTGLVLSRPLSTTEDGALLLKSHHFGLFLQKINILKDQAKDEQEGRYFVPERKSILESLKSHCDQAFSYITSLPTENRDYKLFCAFSFFLGLVSLPFIEKSWVSKVADKIPRAVTEKFLAQIQKNIDDNQFLLETYQSFTSRLKNGSSNLPASVDLGWFKEIYPRSLSSEHLRSLGMA